MVVDTERGRYRLPFAVREYAARLSTASERLESERRHGAWFAQHGAVEATDLLDHPAGRERRDQVVADLPNMAAACRRAVARGDTPMAVNLLRALASVTGNSGPFGLLLGLAERVAALPGPTPFERVTAHNVLAVALFRVGRADEAERILEESLGIAARSCEPSVALRLRTNFATLLKERSPERAYAILDDVRARAPALLPLHRACAALVSFAGAAEQLGRLGEARAAYEEVERHPALQAWSGRAAAVAGLASLDRREGWWGRARARTELALALARAQGSRNTEMVSLLRCGTLELYEGDARRAAAWIEEAVAVARDLGARQNEGLLCLELADERWTQADVAASRQRVAGAAALGADPVLLALHRARLGEGPLGPEPAGRGPAVIRAWAHQRALLEAAAGERTAARASAELAEAAARQAGDHRQLVLALLLRAEVAGDEATALGHVAAARALGVARDAPRLHARVVAAAAPLEAAAGRATAAWAALEAVGDTVRGGDLAEEVVAWALARAQVARGLRRTAEAAESLGWATRRAGDRPDLLQACHRTAAGPG